VSLIHWTSTESVVTCHGCRTQALTLPRLLVGQKERTAKH